MVSLCRLHCTAKSVNRAAGGARYHLHVAVSNGLGAIQPSLKISATTYVSSAHLHRIEWPDVLTLGLPWSFSMLQSWYLYISLYSAPLLALTLKPMEREVLYSVVHELQEQHAGHGMAYIR
jgi:hypothetical protein